MKNPLCFCASICALCFSVFCSAQTVNFADSIIDFSSEYNTTTWSASQALGEPDVYPNYGDLEGAWAQYEPKYKTREFLEFYFEDAIPIDSIHIYETYTCGAVDTVYVRNPNSGEWEIVYQGNAQFFDYARIFRIGFPMTDYPVSAIRIAINPYYENYNEIDAIAAVNSTSVGVSEQLILDNIAIYPNPSDQRYNINLEGLEDVRVQVFDITGTTVLTESPIFTDKYQFKLEGAAGIYVLKLTSGNQSRHFRLVKR